MDPDPVLVLVQSIKNPLNAELKASSEALCSSAEFTQGMILPTANGLTGSSQSRATLDKTRVRTRDLDQVYVECMNKV